MHRKHPGSGWRAQSRCCLPSTPGRGVRPQIGEGRYVLCSPKMKLLLLANRGKAEVWRRRYQALGTVPVPVGYWTRGFPVVWHESRGDPPPGMQLPHTQPQGAGHLLHLPPPLHRSLHQRTQQSSPHILREPRPWFPDSLQPSLSAGALACVLLIILQDLGVRPRMAAP